MSVLFEIHNNGWYLYEVNDIHYAYILNRPRIILCDLHICNMYD